MKKKFFVILFIAWSKSVFAQSGTISGDLQSQLNFFMRDSGIGAYNTPQYDNYLTGLESWLNLNYSGSFLDAGIRIDVFNNSNLINPTQAYTAAGIGYYYLEKEMGDLTVRGGYFYEQFGSGIIYRSYEDRGLGIDYATYGLNLKYRLGEKWIIKGIAGQQKNLFSRFNPVIKGINMDGIVDIGEKIRMLPGAAVLNRTLDETSMSKIVSTINTYDSLEQFIPRYNVYAITGYYTLNLGDFSWYTEGAYKTHEAIYNNESKLVDEPGNVIYSSLAFSKKGIGLTGEVKRTENFELRTSPNESLLQGVLNFVPPMSRQNSLRLPARYSPQTLYLGEMAFQGTAIVTPKKGYTIELNYSHIDDLDGNKLWREIYGHADITKGKKWQFQFGGQYVFYNQEVYRKEPLPDLTAITPFFETTWKVTKKKSMRMELQYQSTEEDFGSMLFGLLEFNIAPTWSFSASDMYNYDPNPEKTSEKEHYYNFFISFTKNSNRFSLAYVKQVAGINCTGGVCRYEPAFSGVKFGLTSSF